LELHATVRDVEGNVLSGVSVSWTSSDTRLATVSQGGLVSGVAVGGPVTITGILGGLSAASQVTVVGGTPTQLTITTQPAGSAVSGTALSRQPVIQVLDADGNEVHESGIVVTATLAVGTGALTNSTVVTDANGRATFVGLAISGAAGTYALRFQSAGLSDVTSESIVLSEAAADIVIMTQPSATAQNGVPLTAQPVVEVRDGGGNVVAGQLVIAAIASGDGILGGTTTVMTDSEGVAEFADLRITGTIGARTLRFAAGSVSVTSSTISLEAGPPAALAITTQPSSTARSGEAFAQQPAVRVSDISGNPVSGHGVTATIASGGGTVGGATTVTTDGSGVAAFTDLSITGLGAHTLRFSASSESVVSGTVDITAGVPGSVVILTQPPSTAVSGVTFSQAPQVAVRDGGDNPVSGQNVTVTIAFGDGFLSGPTSVITDAAGIATFTDLWIGVTSQTAGDQTLRFTAGSAEAITSAIAVSLGVGTHLDLPYCLPGTGSLMDVYVPSASFPRPLPAAVFVHGGGWNSGDKSEGALFPEIRSELLGRGYVVFSVNYRLAPASKWPAQIHDVKCAIRSLRANANDYGLDPARIGVWGHSAGGHLVAMLGVTDPGSANLEGSLGYTGYPSYVQAVVNLAGVTDVTVASELQFNGPADVFQSPWPPPPITQELTEASPINWVTSGDSPHLHVHGTADIVVAPAQAQRLHTLLQGASVPSALVLVTDADHTYCIDAVCGPINPTTVQIVQQVANFLDTNVRFSVVAVSLKNFLRWR
jgi:acetyl esterase/lipase